MSIEEAIERLEGRRMTMSMCLNHSECIAENEAIDMAIDALQKQTNPKKTITLPCSIGDVLYDTN